MSEPLFELVHPDYSLVAKIYIEEQIKLVDSQAAEIIALRKAKRDLTVEVEHLNQLIGPGKDTLSRLVRERDEAIEAANSLKLVLDDHAWRMHKAARDLNSYRMDD